MPVLLQAVMELGATVCTIHQTPSCGSCPVRRHCHAFSQQEQHNQAAWTKGAAAPLVTDFPIKVSSCVLHVIKQYLQECMYSRTAVLTSDTAGEATCTEERDCRRLCGGAAASRNK